jgi:hypothetical protein
MPPHAALHVDYDQLGVAEIALPHRRHGFSWGVGFEFEALKKPHYSCREQLEILCHNHPLDMRFIEDRFF